MIFFTILVFQLTFQMEQTVLRFQDDINLMGVL